MAGITGNIRRYIGKDSGMVKEALSMAWPSVLESFFVALAGMVDSMMVSSIGAYAVAAVGLTTQPKFIGLALFIATNVSVSAIVARRKGEGNREGANETLILACIFTALAGIAVSLACVVFADPVIRFCGSGADTHEGGVVYFRIIMGGMIFNILSLCINAAQRGAGKTRIAMVTNVTSNVTNIIGNYALIGGHFGFPAMGIRGAAIATVFGTVIACLLSVLSLFKKDSYVSIPYILRERIGLCLAPAKSMVRVGSGVFFEQILMRIGFMFTAVMAANMGTDAFAAHQVGMNVLTLTFSFGDGMQVAAVALIGQSLGARKPVEAKRYGEICQRIGFVIAVILVFLYFIGARGLYSLYFKEEHIIEMGIMIMHVAMAVTLFQIAQVIYMGVLRGAGDVLFTMCAMAISVTFIRSFVGYVACYPMGMGLFGIWLGILSDQVSRYLFTSFRFRSGAWTKIKI